MGLRGWTWPEVLNVYVNPGVPCTILCDTLFCGEVKRARGCQGLQSLEPGNINETDTGVVVAEASSFATSVSASQEIILETPITMSHEDIAVLISQSGSLSTTGSVPRRTHTSQVSRMLPQSTGRRAVPTRTAGCDDMALPIAPGGMGAIQAPGIPVDRANDGSPEPSVPSEAKVDHFA